MNKLFPIFVKLDQIETLLIGGGKVGLEKFLALIAADDKLHLTIVAKEIDIEFLEILHRYPHVKVCQRRFEEDDLYGKQLVIAATNDVVVNEEIRMLASKHKIILNIADKPALCDFYLGSVVRKGNLKIAISTNGKSPTIAKRIKEFLSELLPEEIDESLMLMSELREQLKGDFEEKVRKLNEHTKNILVCDGH